MDALPAVVWLFGGGRVVHLISDSIVANHSQNGFVERIASFFNDIQEAQNLTEHWKHLNAQNIGQGCQIFLK